MKPVKMINTAFFFKNNRYKMLADKFFGEHEHNWGARNINLIARFIAEWVDAYIELVDVKLETDGTYTFYFIEPKYV